VQATLAPRSTLRLEIWGELGWCLGSSAVNADNGGLKYVLVRMRLATVRALRFAGEA